MPESKKQHFVPKYYFRLFNSGYEYIHLLHKKTGEVNLFTSIKGQCQKNYLYGDKELEDQLAQLDDQHAIVLNKLVSAIESNDFREFFEQDVAWLTQFVLFQRSRTRMQAEKKRKSHEDLRLHLFREYVKDSKGFVFLKQLDEAIYNKQFTLHAEENYLLLSQISSALQCAIGIVDLELYFLENHSEYPFIFGDSPVIFYNLYAFAVKNRGVLGVQCPGLIIFVPLTQNFMLMLIDKDKYNVIHDRHYVTVLENSIVSQLNILQLYHSQNSVYFCDESSEAYVSRLWKSHYRNVSQPKDVLNLNANILVDGRKLEGQLIHSFEPQIDYRLDLPFITTIPVSEEEYVFRPRDPELHKMLKENTQD